MLKKKFSSLQNILWYSPLFLAFVLSFTCVGVTSLDSGLYLKKAYEFTQGQFDWGMRPGFIFLLGVAFKFLGPSVWSATVVIRIFFLANVVLVFYMTKYLADKKAAFSAAMTLLTSYYLSFLSHKVLLDNIHPFFVIFAIFLSVLAIDRHSDKLAIAAGLAFVYAYLVKSTTLLFIPFPLVLIVLWFGIRLNFFRLKQAVKVCVTSGIGIVLCHISFAFLAAGRKQAEHALGKHSDRALGLFLADSMTEMLYNALQGFIGFWNNFIFQDTWLGWLFVASWVWIFFLSIKNKYSRTMLAVLMLFLPAMLYLGMTSLRLGQAGIFLFVSFIPVGMLISDLSNGLVKISTVWKEKYAGKVEIIAGATCVIMTILFCYYQTWYVERTHRSSSHFLRHTYIGRLLQGQGTEWQLMGKLDQESKTAVEIINNHALPNATVVTGMTNNWAVDFFTSYQYEVSRISTGYIRAKSLQKNFSEDLPDGTIKKNLVFLWPNGWVRRLEHWTAAGELRIRYIDRDRLSRQLKSNGPVFVALDCRYAHIGEYLDMVPGAVKLSNSPLVYRVDDFELSNAFKKPRVALEMGMLLNELRDRRPDNYSVLRDDFFPRFFGLTPEQVDALADGDENRAGVLFMGLPGRSY